MQRLPMTSAVRIDGERLYKKARRGEEVDRPEREVEVHRADLIEAGEGTATFEIECSAGTYVRTLIETLGDAYCESLRRTRVGELTLPAEGEDREAIRPAGELVEYLPAIELDADSERLVRNGIGSKRRAFEALTMRRKDPCGSWAPAAWSQSRRSPTVCSSPRSSCPKRTTGTTRRSRPD